MHYLILAVYAALHVRVGSTCQFRSCDTTQSECPLRRWSIPHLTPNHHGVTGQNLQNRRGEGLIRCSVCVCV